MAMRAPGGCRERDAVGDRRAGTLHQFDAGDPAGDREAVGLTHFGVGQQFDHGTSEVGAECVGRSRFQSHSRDLVVIDCGLGNLLIY